MSLHGVRAVFFWPKGFKGIRDPNINMPYFKAVIVGKEAYYWGIYAEDCFRRGKFECDNAVGDCETDMLNYLRENSLTPHPRPVCASDLSGVEPA